MNNLYARTVFFVKDAQLSLRFYLEKLGFTLDWSYQEESKPFVLQVSLLGFQLILNQTEPGAENRSGHGRLFIGLEPGQVSEFARHVREKNIKTDILHWGARTLVIRDLDANELFIWLPDSEWSTLEAELASAQQSAR